MIHLQDTLTHRQLKSLIHVSTTINSTLDIDTIFKTIMIETISAVDAAGGGSLWLYNEEKGCLIAKSAQGLFYPHIFRQIRLQSGESMTGMTFAAKRCLVFPSAEEIRKALATLSPDNSALLKKSIPHNFKFTSVICSPILLKGDCIGVITLDSFQHSLNFKQEDINLLEAICHQAAIALEKTSLYQEKEETVRKLSDSIEVHRNLANLVVNGEGLESILNYIQKTIGQHTLLFDDLGELITAASDSSLSNKKIDFIKQYAKQIILTLEKSRYISEIELDGELFQLVVLSLGSKHKSLGMLMTLSKQRMIELDIAALEHACTVISLEVVKEQAVFETQQRLRGEFVKKIFSGQMDETIIQKAKHLNFDLNQNYVTTIINLRDNEKKQNSVTERKFASILQSANQIFLENNPKGMVVRYENQIVVLLALSSNLSPSIILAKIKGLAKGFQQRVLLKHCSVDVSIGIGGVKQGLLYVHKSFIEATKCLKFIETYQFEDRVFSYSDLGIQRFILQNSEEELIDFIQEVLGSLIEYEQSRKGELLTTLFIYFDQNQNVKKTADMLHIHTNTLTYRLKRIEEILLINLTESKQLFNLNMAINIYQYLKNMKAFQ
jgi:sugar diacid utilization regulator